SKEGLVGCESKTNEGLDESSIGRARTACGSFSNSARTLRRRFAPRKILANNAPRRKSLPAMRQCHSLLTLLTPFQVPRGASSYRRRRRLRQWIVHPFGHLLPLFLAFPPDVVERPRPVAGRDGIQCVKQCHARPVEVLIKRPNPHGDAVLLQQFLRQPVFHAPRLVPVGMFKGQ